MEEEAEHKLCLCDDTVPFCFLNVNNYKLEFMTLFIQSWKNIYFPVKMIILCILSTVDAMLPRNHLQF